MKLVGDDIGGVESFMKRFKVRPVPLLSRETLIVDGPPGRIASVNNRGPSYCRTFFGSYRGRFRDCQMGSRDHICMSFLTRFILSSFPLIPYRRLVLVETNKLVIHYIHGCVEIESKGERSITSLPY